MKKNSYIALITLISCLTMMSIVTSNNRYMETTSAYYPNNNIDPLVTQSYENETLLSHNMNVRIQEDNSIKITSTFVLTNNNSVQKDYFLLIINKTITSVFCYDPIGSLEFSWEVNPIDGNLINITLRYPVFPDEVYVFSVSYYIEDALYHVEGLVEYYGLDYELVHPRNTEVFNLEICLPKDATLLSESPPDPVFPNADKVFEDNGIFKIQWQLTNLDMNDSDVFLIRYEFLEDIIPGANLRPLYYILAVLGGLTVGGLGVFIYYYFRTKPSEQQLVKSLLSDTEQEVINAINVDGGVSTQRRICDKTGYSKSKVSQILAKLEEKKVLKRERWGRTNKVTITNESFKKINLDSTSEA
ncbi:MAG: winged helix-turn-helix transcriptional regulator [Asgard group archaeon]|nr:winged helix-turn-helix transcriptional regulator [Asgard group archaeon]